jgi:hypothetical protein
VPRNIDRLYGYLENSVYEVSSPDDNGIFHPKVWVLRFLSKEAKSIRYRILCSSRNLSADRSWDTLLSLDGHVVERKVGISANHPLADFIATLPKLTIKPMPEERKKNIDRIQKELRRTRFELPDGFESYSFWPFGIAGCHGWPFNPPIDRLLIMAPFVDEGFLRRFDEIGNKNILISRLECLNSLPANAFHNFSKVYYFNPDAKPEEGLSDEIQSDYEIPLEGLHAKLSIIEEGWYAYVLTGSANATSAAYKHNVEFMTRLVGKKSQYGIEVFLEKSDKKEVVGFYDLLHEFSPGEPPQVDIRQQEIDKELNNIRDQISKAGIHADVESIDGEKCFQIQLCTRSCFNLSRLSPAIKIKCWPITINEANARPVKLDSDVFVNFDSLSYEALTTFFAFEVAYSATGYSSTVRFVLNILLNNAPLDRKDRLLLSFLNDRHKLIRFLFFLLADESHEFRDLAASISIIESDKAKGGAADLFPISIFEMLVKALHRDPDRLDQVNRLIQDLKKSKEGQNLLPDEFDLIWEPIWQARQEIKNEKQQ